MNDIDRKGVTLVAVDDEIGSLAVIVGEMTKHDEVTRLRMLRYLVSWSEGYTKLEQQRKDDCQYELEKGGAK